MTRIFRPAEIADLEEIMTIIADAVGRMLREGKQQWDETYPTSQHIAADIRNGDAYVIESEGRVIAYGAVVFTGEEAYESLQGAWLSDRPYVVVHRMAVAQNRQGKGLARIFLESTESLARSKGIGSFRIDTNFDNFPMLHLLDKCGFTYCGEIRYSGGARRAYEKLL